MDDIDKLCCKEETLDMSDVDNSANDDHRDIDEMPKKQRKRRRREIDMIKISDDDETDEENSIKKCRRYSPGPNSPASHREPRTCVLKASQKRRPLIRLLEQLLRNLEKKDPHQFFAWPVNDNFAPNYSNIIRKPMDFSTMKQKIDDNEYKSLNCFINDFKLMCNNAMKYNKTGTVYHKAARRLLHAGLKQLTPAKLRPLGAILTYMYEIPIRELGFDIGKMDFNMRRGNSPVKSGEEAELMLRQDDIKMEMEAERVLHRRRLAKKAFPRMDGSGKTTLCIVGGEVTEDRHSRPPTLRSLVPKLTHGTGTLHVSREDRRNLVKGVKPLNYGPFGSHAPSYDGTFATLTKEQSHLLYHTLSYETGQLNEEVLRFASDSPWSLLYDMETLFPSRKAQTEAEIAAEEPNLATMKVDVEELRTLSKLGIDVDFLDNIEEDIVSSQHDYGIGAGLQNTVLLLQKLEKEQRERLSCPPPWHLSLCSRATAAERESSRQLLVSLADMCRAVTPGALVSANTLRAAMGVTLDHLDTPVSMDELEMDGETRVDASSDRDSRSSHDPR